jgi:hypothetical protein
MNSISAVSRSRVASAKPVPSMSEMKRNVSADHGDVRPVARNPSPEPRREKLQSGREFSSLM